ncbi:MAG: DUF6495 family protein [Saprospiraceae bacterium]
MKYRRLTLTELQELEKEFTRFLASHSVTANEWVKIKENSPEKMENLLGIFSDIVFDKILGNVEYLEHKRAKDFRVYQFKDDKAVMFGLFIQGESDIDFRKEDDTQSMMTKIQTTGASVKLFAGEKKYKFTKEMEIFKVMEEGALISKDASMFNTLQSLIKK